MTSSTLKARIVHVKIEEGKTGLFYATSQDLKGLLVAEDTLDKLEKEIPNAIAEMYQACGERVIVSRIEDRQTNLASWAAIPAEVAKQALREMAVAC